MSVFLNDALELRRGWRFATFWLVYIVLLVATSAVMSVLIPGPVDFGQPKGLALSTFTFLPPAVLSFLFMLRFVEHRSASTFGVGFFSRWARDLSLGVAIAGGMALFYLIATTTLGGASITPADASWSGILLTVALLLLAAASEELVYRGYPLQILIQALRPAPAIALMSLAFGMGHHMNPNATWLGTLNTGLAGVLLSVAYLRTRSLWLPWGIHIGWNLATGVVLGLPVSGVYLRAIWTTAVDGAGWISGGSFGPEGGILSTIAIIAAAVFVFGITRGRLSKNQEVL